MNENSSFDSSQEVLEQLASIVDTEGQRVQAELNAERVVREVGDAAVRERNQAYMNERGVLNAAAEVVDTNPENTEARAVQAAEVAAAGGLIMLGEIDSSSFPNPRSSIAPEGAVMTPIPAAKPGAPTASDFLRGTDNAPDILDTAPPRSIVPREGL